METQKRNRFWQLHSILGVVVGLPLFVIFFAGTLAFFEPHAIHWLQPQYGVPPEETPALDPVVDRLLDEHPGSDELTVVLASGERPVIDLYIEANHRGTHYWLDPSSLELAPATPHEGDLFHFFVDLHYFNFFPFGKELAGVFAALFFTIILTGIVYQWRSIRKDAHPRNLSLSRKGRWKSIHRFTSLLTLPFQALYSVTGASLAVGLLLAAPAVFLFFDGDQEALNETLFPGLLKTAPPGEGRSFPVDGAIAFARDHWPADVELRFLQLADLAESDHHPETRTISLYGKQEGVHFVGTHLLTLDGDLNILHDQSPTSHLGPMLIEGLVNLHFGTFNTLIITSLFVFGGLVVSLSIGAGVYVFLDRQRRSPRRAARLLAVLTDALLGGLPLAAALSLHVVQIHPGLSIPVFAAAVAAALVCRSFSKGSLSWLGWLSGVGFVLLPLTFVTVHQQSPLQWGSVHGQMITLFNLFFVLAGIGILALTAKLKP